MPSKNRLKYLASLSKKKQRKIEGKFIVEGVRALYEGLNSDYVCEEVFIDAEHSGKVNDLIELSESKGIPVTFVSGEEIKKIADTKSPQSVAALFRVKSNSNLSGGKFIVALDDVADPGNLGTIIRTCDWFGVENILISANSVDLFNPKVIRSTMGSIFHINYEIADDLSSKLNEIKSKGYKILAADMSGKSVKEAGKIESKVVLVLGSEAFGVSTEVMKTADYAVSSPGNGKAESLNVAVAGAILIYELFGGK